MKHSATYCPAWRDGVIAAAVSFAVGLLLVWLLFGLKKADVPVAAMPLSHQQISRTEETFLANRAINLLEPLVGKGKVRAELRLDLDFDTVTTDEEIFDPDGQVLRSYTAAQNFASEAEYEINKFSRRIVQSGARLKRMSALILVDGIREGNTYRQRSRAELSRLAELVAPVIGFDLRRGDVLQIESVRFVGNDSAFAPTEFAEIILLTLLCLGLAVLVFRSRNGVRRPDRPRPAARVAPQKSFPDIWKKLQNADVETLTAYLSAECAAAAAYVVSRLGTPKAAAVMAGLDPVFAAEISSCLLSPAAVAPEIAAEIERTLERDFAGSPSRGGFYLGEVLKNMTPRKQKQLLAALEKENAAAAEKLRSRLFNFEDFRAVTPDDIHRLFDEVEAETLALALRGASEELRQYLFDNMSVDAAAVIGEKMAALGPVRLCDVEAAQDEIITLACRLAAEKMLVLRKRNGETV